MINKSLKDRLHQDYRKTLIHEYDRVKEICMDNGSRAFFVSGSGPTLMNIIDDVKFIETIKDNLLLLDNKWEAKLLEADEKGVVVENMNLTR